MLTSAMRRDLSRRFVRCEMFPMAKNAVGTAAKGGSTFC